MEATESTPAESPYVQPLPAAKRPKLKAESPSQAADWSVRLLPNLVNYPRKRTAMACDVCRVRKSRCDSGRPNCASCTHLGVACSYRGGYRPEQDAAETFLSKLDSRLERIEALLDQKYGYQAPIADTPMPPTPASSYAHAATGSPHPTPAGACEALAASPLRARALGFDRIGLSFVGFTNLAGHEVPPTLEPLDYDEGESYLNCEIEQGRLLYQAGDPTALDLSPRVCWRLQQSFARNILPWFPLFDQEEYSGWAAKTYNHDFDQDDLATCLILFMLSLGALSKAQDLTSDDPRKFPGLNYFLAACRILNRDPTPRYSLLETQCQILMPLYLLLCLRPLQASHALSVASRSVLTLLNLRSRLDDDVQLRKSCHRAYWVSFILEHEVIPHISYTGPPLPAIHEAIPLPFSHHNEPDIFWFLAEISIRRLYTYAIETLWKPPCPVYAPRVIEVLRQQVSHWYDGLPLSVKFPRDMVPILDLQRAFLRTQYFGLCWVINWSAIIRVVTKEPDDEKQHAELLESSRECIHYAIAHILSAETLLQERHQMLFANLLGTYYAVMALLVTYRAPALESVQNPTASAAILQGHNMMSIWAANPGVASYIRRIEEGMVRQGLLATNKPTAPSASNAGASVPPVFIHQRGVLSDVGIQRVAGASSDPMVEHGPLVRSKMELGMVMDQVMDSAPALDVRTATLHAAQSVMSGSNVVQYRQQ